MQWRIGLDFSRRSLSLLLLLCAFYRNTTLFQNVSRHFLLLPTANVVQTFGAFVGQGSLLSVEMCRPEGGKGVAKALFDNKSVPCFSLATCMS